MQAANVGPGHCILSEHSGPSQSAAGSADPEDSRSDVTPAVSHLQEAMRPDSCGVSVSLGSIQEMARGGDQQNLGDQRQELESQIFQTYHQGEKDSHHLSGANRFLAYLERAEIPLAEVSKRDLEQWALIPIATAKGQSNLPSVRIFEGAKGLCACAAQLGYIDAERAKDIAECPQPRIDISVLRSKLQNPMLTSEERESHILVNYQMMEKNVKRQGGARDFLAYVKS